MAHRDAEIMDVKYSSDSRTICTAGSDCYLNFFDLISGKNQWSFKFPFAINVIDFKPIFSNFGGSMMAACDFHNTINLLKLTPKPQLISHSMHHNDVINSCKLSSTSDTAVTCSEDKTIKVWDLEKSKL